MSTAWAIAIPSLAYRAINSPGGNLPTRATEAVQKRRAVFYHASADVTVSLMPRVFDHRSLRTRTVQIYYPL